jgi:ADP-heptose:LPS heptosyltransferase
MRVLVFRLSSLGDVLISTSFLENLPDQVEVDWVVASDFEFVLKGHPRIRKLWVFERKSGLRGWLQLLGKLRHENFDHRVDLHRTHRTRVAFGYFLLSDLFLGKRISWLSVSKERIRTWMLFLLKRNLPRAWVPTPYWQRFARLGRAVARTGVETDASLPLRLPSFLPRLKGLPFHEQEVLDAYRLSAKSYYALMPSSRWPAKEWGVEAFFSLVTRLSDRGWTPLLLGRPADQACERLKERLVRAGVDFRHALDEPDFLKTAVLLRNASFYVGCDTGMSHLAESVGCPAVVIFGPTRPELGFGPCRDRSRAVINRIACSPCSKDGRICFRVTAPNQCMKGLLPDSVLRAILEVSQ